MSKVIAGQALVKLVESGVISGLLSNEQINAASIDITLSNMILTEPSTGQPITCRLKDRDAIPFNENDITDGNVVLAPGEFILASTNEIFNLPNNISAMYKLKSSMARIGLEHLNAGWCDAGWNGSSLTLELKNMTNRTSIVLDHNVKIGQVVFFEHEAVPEHLSYATKGSYNNQQTTTASKQEVQQEVKYAPKGSQNNQPNPAPTKPTAQAAKK